MKWIEYFDQICIINLARRTDRMTFISDMLHDYQIVPFVRVEAHDNAVNPRKGLVTTMQAIFSSAIGLGYKRIMILEDDATPLVSKEVFHDTMNSCVEQLPPNWDLLYLGCNASGGFHKGYFTPNLLEVQLAYATHAVCYSRRAMEFISKRTINEPVDNYIVREFQPNHVVLCTYPMLMTQIPGHSDIGGSHCDWSNELEKRFEQNIQMIPK